MGLSYCRDANMGAMGAEEGLQFNARAMGSLEMGRE